MSDASPGAATVRIPASRVHAVRSPGRSLTDASSPPALVRVWAVNYPFRRHGRLTLAVDAATARQVTRYHRSVAAAVLTAAAAVLVGCGYAIAILVGGARSFPAALVFLPLPAVATGLAVLTTIATLRWRPAIYPRMAAHDEILITGIDPAVAEEWRSANEPGLVTIVETDGAPPRSTPSLPS